jgi:hypothetical protein
MTKPAISEGATPKGPEVELAEAEAWDDFDKIDTAAAGRAAASPSIDGSPVTKAFEQVTDDQDGRQRPAEKTAAASDGGKPAATAVEAAPATGTAPAVSSETKTGTKPFEYLPEDLRARVQADWEKENAALRGRVAPVQRENQNLRRRVDELSRQPAQPAPRPKDIALPGDPNWEKFKKDYPEIAAPIENRLAAALGGVRDYTNEVVETRVKPVETRFSQSQTETELERAARVLAAKHPDFYDISQNNDAFDAWLSTLPPKVAALIDSKDPNDADYLLTRFKAETGYKAASDADPPPNGGNPPGANGAHSETRQPALDPRRQRQLDGSRTPAGRGSQPAAAAVTVIPEDAEGAWKAYEKMGL